jgi:hypothetical protein
LKAAECIRDLIEEVRLVPENGKLRIALYGELAALINLANEHPRSKGTGVPGCGDPKPPIPNTLPLHAGSAEIGPNLATTYTELGSSGVRVLMTEV